ncbi:MAG TPA: TetR family transcriptional regulator [Planctomycetaceae bacterium]|nr:TetR family transcriptional regulator [Planctomycetaceae bacterium]
MRNAEATRERILEAALGEFSAHGIAGARVDRIAHAAGCNKNLIYVYFEDKESLFTTVLLKHLMRIHDEEPFTPDDLPIYAGKVFDFAVANPDLMRLMAWSALEQKPEGHAERVATLEEKIRALAEAQKTGRVGTAFPPGFLVIAVMSLAMAWSAAGTFASLQPKAERSADLRRNIIEAVRLLSKAGKGVRAARKTKSR